MKKIKNNTSRHVASTIIALIFALLCIGSEEFPWWGQSTEYEEGPCVQLPPTTLVYKFTVTVSDAVTGKPIPNASVSINVFKKTAKYLGSSMCVITPLESQTFQLSMQTNSSGIAYREVSAVFYSTNLDHALYTCSVSAANHTSSEFSKRLYPDETAINIDIGLIDLTTEP